MPTVKQATRSTKLPMNTAETPETGRKTRTSKQFKRDVPKADVVKPKEAKREDSSVFAGRTSTSGAAAMDMYRWENWIRFQERA